MHSADTAAEWDEETFERALALLRIAGTIDAAGVRISAERLTRILDAAPEDPAREGQRLFKGARFRGAIFEGSARFRGATFEGTADFRRATFKARAEFGVAAFERVAVFDGATFESSADFLGASFNGPATVDGRGGFQRAVFKGEASFTGATFSRGARFDGATFDGRADFLSATFKGDVRFMRATFKGPAVFGSAAFEDATIEGDQSRAEFVRATFAAGASFLGASFESHARFSAATFERDREFGPVRVGEALALDGAIFHEAVRLLASASMLDCTRAQFRRGADVFVQRAVIVLDDADFAEPSILAPWPDVAQGEEVLVRQDFDSDEDTAPRLVSMRRTKVVNLTITGVDLHACRFEGAHGLDRLRLERVRFAQTPSGWQQRSKRWRMPIRWTRRLAIAEEHHWRAERDGAVGWYGPEVQAPSGLEARPLNPEQIAATYRSLRKGREDSKDEPGAADFYYGEMEMRRQRPNTQGAERPSPSPAATSERLILWLYWLVCGYGLRASRALIALAVTVVVFAFLFDSWGFQPDRDLGRTLLFSIESTSSLFRAPETEGSALTAGGEVLQIVLRLLGPLFFGLALLSLRGRVKR